MTKSAKILLLIIYFSTLSPVVVHAKSDREPDAFKVDLNPDGTLNSAPKSTQPTSPFAVGNFFSASAAAAVKPSVEKRPGPKDAIGSLLVDLNPTLEQVRLIPSLDGPQRKQVGDLYNVYRSDLKLLNDQLRPLREEFRTRLKSEKEKLDKEKIARAPFEKPVLPKEEEDPIIRETVDKIKAKQLEFTQALSKIVTPAQMLELEQLRRGKVPTYAQ
ncbi:hypothetical protein BH11CYA1_BH11CYA1_26580 [soil metagenome]